MSKLSITSSLLEEKWGAKVKTGKKISFQVDMRVYSALCTYRQFSLFLSKKKFLPTSISLFKKIDFRKFLGNMRFSFLVDM
jgi:hypothetical protein